MSNLPYNLQPTTSNQNTKAINMLDNIPFVLSNQVNVNTNSYTSNLEDTKQFLLSVKKKLESDVFNYDFSNEKKLVKDVTSFVI